MHFGTMIKVPRWLVSRSMRFDSWADMISDGGLLAGFPRGELKLLTHDIGLRWQDLRKSSRSPNGGRDAVRENFGMKIPPTAVVRDNDQVAIGVLHELDRMRECACKALAIVCCDDVVAAEC
jgi:hypothetical protein